MPAPAVIPAPRAYINAVAVKGFVVELRAAKETTKSLPSQNGLATVALAAREQALPLCVPETGPRERFDNPSSAFQLFACNACYQLAGGRPRFLL